MLEGYVHKCEKTRWRQFFLMVVLSGTVILFYSSSSQFSWPLKTWTHRNWTALDGDVSQCYVEYPHEYGLIIDEPHRCEEERPFLVLMVPVAPNDRTSRDAIRNTWGKQTTVMGKEVRHYFVLGATTEGMNGSVQQQVFEESQQHHDIIQSDFLDSYKNLTVKTMVMFEWLSSHCPASAYAMKIDSDIFLNVPKLIVVLSDAPPHSYMTGFIARNSVVVRDKNSKWYMPYSAFPETNYPPYALGLGYVFSMDLPKRILEASARVRAVYIEDVYVGFCMRDLGIPLWDPPYVDLFRAGVPFFRTRCYWSTVITTIMRDSNHLLETWRKYQSQLQYCT